MDDRVRRRKDKKRLKKLRDRQRKEKLIDSVENDDSKPIGALDLNPNGDPPVLVEADMDVNPPERSYCVVS